MDKYANDHLVKFMLINALINHACPGMNVKLKVKVN